MHVFGLIGAPPADKLASGERTIAQVDAEAICAHAGVAAADLVRMATGSLDVAGSSDCLRHFVAIDHDGRAVVLALRGTASISDVLHDAVAFAEPFCGGLAHAGMARM